MPTYYDVVVDRDIPHGSDILDKSCTVQFTYPNGSHSDLYPARVFAWLAPPLVRIVSPVMNIQAAWFGAEYGTLTIQRLVGPLVFRIVGFSLVPAVAAPEQTRLEYIQSLELAAPASLLSLPVPSGEIVVAGQDTAYVAAGSVASFVENLSVERQQDVLNSTLLAQLAATKKFNRETNTREWYSFYGDVLENLGWGITGFGFQEYQESATHLRMDKVALDLIASIATSNELVVLTKALGALASSDGKPTTIFDASGSTGNSGNFQIATCKEDKSGNVTTSFGAFYFAANSHQGRFLFWTWETKSINFYFSTRSLVLNEQIYSGNRETVIAKLGSNAKTFIADLEI